MNVTFTPTVLPCEDDDKRDFHPTVLPREDDDKRDFYPTVLPPEDDDKRDFYPASVADGGQFLLGGNYFFCSSWNV